MFQITCDYQKPWPENEPLRVEGHFDQEITISPTLARRRANGFLAGYVTMMVSAGQPTLILSEQPIWRIPAILNLPQLGEVGALGAIDIDAQTGKIILPSPKQISRMVAKNFAKSDRVFSFEGPETIDS